MCLHFIAGLEYVLDDPQPFAQFDLKNAQLAAVADIDKGQVIGAKVYGFWLGYS